jgi:hypothetical protein
MHNDLITAFNKLVEIIKADERCKGGWHYGSVGRNQTDIYSDYDPIFLVADKDFEQFAVDVPKMLKQISDELLICWAESFNSNFFKNYCNVIRLGDNLHQLDFFILNYNYPDEWWCRHHCKGCTRDNIFFDRNGETAEFLDKGYTTDNYIPDIVRAMDTYWFHAMMLVKYFKRKDIFNLLKNISEFMFHAHVDLLLSHYDKMDWGAWETKVKYCVPEEKQEHLKMYFIPADISIIQTAVEKCIILFKNDAQEICKEKEIDYPVSISQQVISYFNKNVIS